MVSLKQTQCLGILAADRHKWQVLSVLVVPTVVANLFRCSIHHSLSTPRSLPVLAPLLDSKSQSWLNCKVFLWMHIFLWSLSTITLTLIFNCNLAVFEHSPPVRKDEEQNVQNISSLFLLFWKFWVMVKFWEFGSSFTSTTANYFPCTFSGVTWVHLITAVRDTESS